MKTINNWNAFVVDQVRWHSSLICPTANVRHIGHVTKMSVFEYSDRWFKHQLHQYAVSLRKTLNPHCFSRHSNMQEHHREGCLFSAIRFPEEIALRNQLIFLQARNVNY